jgi:hypothetical protein
MSRDPFDFDGEADPRAEDRPAAPFFTVVEPRNWTPNRVYRIYSDGSRLIGVYAGRSGDVAVLGAQFGLLGGLIAGAVAARDAADRREEETARKSLDELLDAHKYNFVHDATEVDAAELAEPSLWFRLNHATVPQIALLWLTIAGGGRRRFALMEGRDVRRALGVLDPLLGDRLDVRIARPRRR